MYYVNRIFAVVALLALTIASIYSVRLAVADGAFRKQTPEAVGRAMAMLPDRAGYVLLRALQLDYDGADSTALLERAARLNPVSSAPRIRLGLAAEVSGDEQGAEKWLLDAARVDHQFEPRWTLANFYFRRDQTDDFWKWIRAALEVSYGDRRLAFDLCWRVTQEANEVLARAIPDEHDVLSTYLAYLLEQHHEAAGSVALKLAGMRNPSDVPQLEAVCDRLLEAGNVGDARELWKRLGHAQTGLLGNGDFASEPRGHGFDWRLAPAPGVTGIPLPGGYRILLSGKQPESCELLRQFVAVEPGKRYSLRWEMQAHGFPSPSGLTWTAGAAQLERADGSEFVAANAVIPITLRYQRPAGQARAEGTLEIRSVSLVPTH